MGLGSAQGGESRMEQHWISSQGVSHERAGLYDGVPTGRLDGDGVFRVKGLGAPRRKTAERLEVDPSTVQAISMELAGRPFEASAAA